MRRLPVLGTAVLFLAMVGGAAQVSADPITIDAGTYVESNSQAASWVFSGSGISFNGRDRDVDAPGVGALRANSSARLDHSFEDDFPLGSGSFNGTSYGNLWLDGRFSVTSASFTPSASGNSVPFQFTANLTGYSYGSQPGRDNEVFTQQVQGSGTALVSYSQNGNQLVPSSVTYNFGNASSVVTPEPASMLLLGSGLAFAALGRLRRRRRSA